MVSVPAKYTERLINRVSEKLQEVQVTEHDENPDRLLLNISACYGKYDIRISEIIDAGGRKYAYYVICSGEIIIGFDNSPDALALRLKFGSEAKKHWHVRIPHCHLENKTQTELTDEMTCQDFMDWLEHNLLSDDDIINKITKT